MARWLTYLLFAIAWVALGYGLHTGVLRLAQVRHGRMTSGTQLDWSSGPDPNSYYATEWHGSPLPLEQWGHRWNRKAGRDSWGREHVNDALAVAAFLAAWSAAPALGIAAGGLLRRVRGRPKRSGLVRCLAAALVFGVFACGAGGLI